jgi:glyoxylase-like metal-dependent hydrolase (beta-lactamase superfamily II)
MLHERISENVYWFQSELYAQVSAGVVSGPQWAVVIDTLATPDETLAMRAFIEDEIGVPVRYVIDTHYHADHAWGNCFFPGAWVVAHDGCYQALETRGKASLASAQAENPAFRRVEIVLPHFTFSQGQTILRVGKKSLNIFPTPGHSPDGISVLVEEDRILFGGDAFMPLPSFVDGDVDDLIASTKRVAKMSLENIIQGHGDVILRGEIDDALKENIAYLNNVKKAVRSVARRSYPLEALSDITVESCGKSRVLIGGLAEELHQRNLRALLRQTLRQARQARQSAPKAPVAGTRRRKAQA